MLCDDVKVIKHFSQSVIEKFWKIYMLNSSAIIIFIYFYQFPIIISQNVQFSLNNLLFMVLQVSL